VVNKLAGLSEARIDVIADNAGFELVADLCLVDYLLATASAAVIRLHLKPHPTYVSDAMRDDVLHTIARLRQDDDSEVRTVAARLASYIDAGRLQLHDHFFWTSPLAFWAMPGELVKDLQKATLVFVKGDANYRRLLGDRHWPFTTPFEDIVCYFPAPLVALRTLKSEVAAGLQSGQAAEIAGRDPDWLVDGEWGVIQFVDN
jgi:hypothetical protein